jgi:multisubunit Na+/H+ antiporter MnhF subunit
MELSAPCARAHTHAHTHRTHTHKNIQQTLLSLNSGNIVTATKFAIFYIRTKIQYFRKFINAFLLVSNLTSSWPFRRHPLQIKHKEMVVLTILHYPLKTLYLFNIIHILTLAETTLSKKTHTLSNPSLFLCFQSSSISQCVIS